MHLRVETLCPMAPALLKGSPADLPTCNILEAPLPGSVVPHAGTPMWGHILTSREGLQLGIILHLWTVCPGVWVLIIPCLHLSYTSCCHSIYIFSCERFFQLVSSVFLINAYPVNCNIGVPEGGSDLKVSPV